MWKTNKFSPHIERSTFAAAKVCGVPADQTQKVKTPENDGRASWEEKFLRRDYPWWAFPPFPIFLCFSCCAASTLERKPVHAESWEHHQIARQTQLSDKRGSILAPFLKVRSPFSPGFGFSNHWLCCPSCPGSPSPVLYVMRLLFQVDLILILRVGIKRTHV